MNSYIDHHRAPREGEMGWQIRHSWADFTARRLSWLYGPLHATERAALTAADLAAWRTLGQRSAA